MIDQLNEAINEYRMKWQTFVAERSNQTFFAAQKPAAVGWKVQNLQELDEMITTLRPMCDQIHFGWVDERWLVTMHLKATKLSWDIQIIKLTQRRPNSSEQSGFDHIDFYHPQNKDLDTVLHAEKLQWTHKTTGACHYYAIRFSNTEAKLRNDTVIDVCINEMQALQM